MWMMVKNSIVFALSLAIGLIFFKYVVGDLQSIFAQTRPSPKESVSNTTSNATGIIGKNITIPTIDVNNTLLAGRATPITNTTLPPPINSSK
jgi:hypothetical protein